MPTRETPYSLIFRGLAAERFTPITRALEEGRLAAADRDQFVLLEPVGRLLRDLLPDDAPPDALEAQMSLLHHVYRHWAAGGWVFSIAPEVLRSAAIGGPLSGRPPREAQYLQLPEHRVWAELQPDAGLPPEPLDGMYVAAGAEGEISVLGVFGMRRGRPAISVVGVDGRADAADASPGEVEVVAAREDGAPAFTPTMPGADRAGLYSITSPGELLLLAARLIAVLPRDAGVGELP